jgi:hypothetical protein
MAGKNCRFTLPTMLISAAGYNVYRSLKPGDGFAKLKTSIVADTSYLNSSPANGTNYYYLIASVNMSGGEPEFTAKVSSAAGPVSRN